MELPSVLRHPTNFPTPPADCGLPQSPLDTLRVDGPAESAARIRGVLDGEQGPARNIVVLNAAAALLVAGKATDPTAAAAIAAEVIDNGAASDRLAKLADRSQMAR